MERYDYEDRVMTILENGYLVESVIDGTFICFDEIINIGASTSYYGNHCIKCNWLIIQANKHDPKFREEYFGPADHAGYKTEYPFFFRERALILYNEVCPID